MFLRQKKFRTIILALFAAWAFFLLIRALVFPATGGETKLLAHRGIHQIYAGQDRSPKACQAIPTAPAEHGFIANTAPSIAAAYAAGADVVEIDIHLTEDGQFALFHDWTLDCKTDGTGVTRKQSMAYLKSLDLGYGYSPNGTDFPLRGTAIGMMPTLTEILDADLGPQYLINFKANNLKEATALAHLLADRKARAQIFGVYGATKPTHAAIAKIDGLRGYDRADVKRCLLRYFGIGWTGYVPSACQDRLMPVPLDYAPYLWGWPHRFTDRMGRAGTDIILLGPYDGSGFSSGIDTRKTLAGVPIGFQGYLWTDRIERIGPFFKPPL